ncbi:XdhC family protein [Halorussus litoreus]|uniref:XdhC family protein n=1 Tax=Halorussus litoreus TaxID=1710536 RepID=UPI000E26ED54|nr:XdhC/CoxI family protein [Halorussus litoreus]
MDDATGDSWSASTLAVREALREAVEADSRAAVATVSAVEGSAYRRPGAKRVLAGDTGGEGVGGITAGCLEGPVADLAKQALESGPLRETFDLTGEDDTWGFGLGCNGVIDVLVEPADASFRPALDRVADGERVALLTVVGHGDSPDADNPDSDRPEAPVGARALVDESGGVDAAEARPAIPDDVLDAVRDEARQFAETGRSDTLAVETDRGTAELFVDGLEPVPELLVFGHSPDVRPVTRLARDAGFRVTVATGRGARADAEQFPAAHQILATRPPDVAEAISRPAETYAVVMSHNFVDDRLALDALLDTEAPYIGLMGPRKRFEEMREEFAAAGTQLSDADRERISTPVGLDLGGGEPAQIALSVVGEVLAVANGRDGGRLATAEGPIHPRPDLDPDSS